MSTNRAPHRPVHDRWMTDPTDRDYLEPADRWCIICARPDREHVCTTCGHRADAGYNNPAAGERCADKVHAPFVGLEQEHAAVDVAPAPATDELPARARLLGAALGHAVAAWYVDGDKDVATYRRMLEGAEPAPAATAAVLRLTADRGRLPELSAAYEHGFADALERELADLASYRRAGEGRAL